jgi:uncharacterized protein (DUF1778 family)
MKPTERNLIDREAEATGKARRELGLEAAVGPNAYADFLARLDAPAAPNERLRRTMRTPAPWE